MLPCVPKAWSRYQTSRNPLCNLCGPTARNGPNGPAPSVTLGTKVCQKNLDTSEHVLKHSSPTLRGRPRTWTLRMAFPRPTKIMNFGPTFLTCRPVSVEADRFLRCARLGARRSVSCLRSGNTISSSSRVRRPGRSLSMSRRLFCGEEYKRPPSLLLLCKR